MVNVSDGDAPRAPLKGITVVSFEQAVSLPYCTRMLADLGARVIKVEQPPHGDFTRAYDDVVGGLGAHFVWLNRSKESLSLDLKTARAPEILDRLLARADVCVQNLAPGAAVRLGIAARQVHARHPQLVAVDVSGYGHGGPYDHRRAYDLLVQAETGVCSITGTEGHPAKAGPPMADLGTGMHVLTAVLAGLVERATTGKGVAASIGMFDVMVDWMGFALQHTLHTGAELVPVGMGSPKVAPYGAFRTVDGQTVVLGTTNNREWEHLARRMLGRDDLADDANYATNEQRCAARDELHGVIGAWTALRTLAEVQEAADAAGVGNARYNTVRQVLEHPQLVERDRVVQVQSPVGPLPVIRSAIVADEWTEPAGPIPAVGEHTAAILEWIGYADAAGETVPDSLDRTARRHGLSRPGTLSSAQPPARATREG